MPKRIKSNSKLLSILVDEISKKIDFSQFSTYFCGFSGGADSTALLLILKELSQKFKFSLYAVHFEHGLRGEESLKDADWCKEFCRKYDISYLEYELKVRQNKAKSESIEVAARRLRIEKWKELYSVKNSAVVLGHHSDDKLENIMLRLFRGANSSGLSSLRYINCIDGITFVRPLLDYTKKDLEDFLEQSGITGWRIDRSNLEAQFGRNFIRNNVLPKICERFPYAIDGIRHSYSSIQTDAEYIEIEAQKVFKKLKKDNYLNIQLMNKLHPALKIRVLRYWLSLKLGYEYIPDRNFMLRLDRELAAANIKKLIPLDDKHFLKPESSNLFIVEKYVKRSSKPLTWEWQKKSNISWGDFELTRNRVSVAKFSKCLSKDCVYFDLAKMPAKLIIRHWREGDRFIPFGSSDLVRLKKIFHNEKVSEDERRSIPLLCTEAGEIVWVSGVRRSNFAVIDKDTTKLLFFKIKRK